MHARVFRRYSGEDMPAEIQDILCIEVPVIVQIAERGLSVSEVTNLTLGSIIELPKQAEEPLEILVNNKIIGQGVAVKVGENFGIRVSRIGELNERINAMGGGSAAVRGTGAFDGGYG